MTSSERHLALIIEWMDRGFDKGAKKAKFDLDDLKKKARELARDLAIGMAAVTGFGLALYKMAEAGAKVNDMAETFDTVRVKAGLLPGVLNDIREATRGTVTDMKLMAASSRALSDGLDPARLVELWAKSKQIAEVTGTEVPEAFNMLYLAIAKGQTRMLTSIGITLDAEEVTQRYARSIGKETADLTLRDRQMAISLALEEKYVEKFKSLGDLGGDNAEKFERMGVAFANFKDKFFAKLAGSPAVERFLEWMLGKLDAWSASLDGLEPKIEKAVGYITDFYKGLIAFASDKAGPALKTIYEFKDAIIALGAAVGTGVVASKIMGIGVALGLVTGGTATAVTLIAAALAGVTVGLVQSENQMQKTGAAFRGMHGGGMGSYEVFTGVKKEAQAAIITIDELLAKRSMLQMPGTDPGAAGKFGPIAGSTPNADVWKGAPASLSAPEQQAIPILQDVNKQKLDIMRSYYDSVKGMEQEKLAFGIGITDIEIAQARAAMAMRRQIYQQGFSAMSVYTQKFYSQGANMGRVANAMAIRGFGEMTAAFIESKTQEWKFLAMEYSVKAIVAAAEQKWTYAAAYGIAAAKYGAGAGVAALAAGAIRSYTQQKADALAGEQEQEWNAATSGSGEGSNIGARKQATGIVNTRPISIIVNSTSYFQAGNMVFGDSEGAFQDLYNQQIRPKIEGDIDSGMIQVA